MPAGHTVADVRLGDDFAVHLAVNTGAPENAEAAVITLRLVDCNPTHLISFFCRIIFKMILFFRFINQSIK
jgi:hypothetical protein